MTVALPAWTAVLGLFGVLGIAALAAGVEAPPGNAESVAFVLGLRDQDAINLQLLGGVWILQTFPAVAIGLFTTWLHRWALLAGWAVGMVAGTLLVVWGGFSSVVSVGIGGARVPVYAAVVAFALNLAVAVGLTPFFAGSREAVRAT